jgi:hypothetical protein
MLAHQHDGVQELRQALQRVVLGLHRHDDLVRRAQRVDGQQT